MNCQIIFAECSDLVNNTSVDKVGEIMDVVWEGETVDFGQLPHMVPQSKL